MLYPIVLEIMEEEKTIDAAAETEPMTVECRESELSRRVASKKVKYDTRECYGNANSSHQVVDLSFAEEREKIVSEVCVTLSKETGTSYRLKMSQPWQTFSSIAIERPIIV